MKYIKIKTNHKEYIKCNVLCDCLNKVAADILSSIELPEDCDVYKAFLFNKNKVAILVYFDEEDKKCPERLAHIPLKSWEYFEAKKTWEQVSGIHEAPISHNLDYIYKHSSNKLLINPEKQGSEI